MDETDETRVRLAHVSDIHLPDLPPFWPRHWNVKRTLGYANWHRRRRFIHRRDVIDAIVAHMKAAAPDHILVSGDLINIGLPQEYQRAAQWLADVGPPEDVCVVPGNHDIYTPIAFAKGVGLWDAYMTPDGRANASAILGAGAQRMPSQPIGPDRHQATAAETYFPFVRPVGPVDIIALNSAVPTAPGVASGSLGPQQRQALGALLEDRGRAGRFRLVMLHHPPLQDLGGPARGLSDASALQDVLEKAGAELVIHGHNHVHSERWIKGPERPIPVIGIASASVARSSGHEDLGAYQVYEVARSGNAYSVQVERFGLAEPDGHVVALDAYTLDPERNETQRAEPAMID
ncbi:MAG: metallophosphoesterase [Pseudomonadota bacterium]